MAFFFAASPVAATETCTGSVTADFVEEGLSIELSEPWTHDQINRVTFTPTSMRSLSPDAQGNYTVWTPELRPNIAIVVRAANATECQAQGALGTAKEFRAVATGTTTPTPVGPGPTGPPPATTCSLGQHTSTCSGGCATSLYRDSSGYCMRSVISDDFRCDSTGDWLSAGMMRFHNGSCICIGDGLRINTPNPTGNNTCITE